MKILFVILTVAAATLLPDQAFAWGPGVHLALGNSVLAELGCLPPLVAGLLGRHPSAFLYGCLSADIFIGKGTEVRQGHSHNWVTGFKLLNSARDPRVLAYAHGYLSHLAADVVAHNYFVPNALWTMPSGGKLSHVYVEAQADRLFEFERESALALFRRPNRDADGILLSAMDKGRFPFLVKKRLLMGTLRVAGTKEWGHSLRLADRLLPWSLSRTHIDEMVELARRVVFDCLSDPWSTKAVSFDPIGSRNLREVRRLRMETRSSRRKPGTRLFAPHEHLTSLPNQPVDAAPRAVAASG